MGCLKQHNTGWSSTWTDILSMREREAPAVLYAQLLQLLTEQPYWFKQSSFTLVKIWTITENHSRYDSMSIKQAKLIVNAHKHNLLNSFCNNRYATVFIVLKS